MTDEAYIFKQDVRDKAITARSSHKVGVPAAGNVASPLTA